MKFDLLKEAEKAKQEGLIKHISFSFHDKPEVMKKIIGVGLFESVLCQYNLLDRANEETIAYAKEKGLGVVIMGPVAGGRLAALSQLFGENLVQQAKSTPEVALRFVLGNQNVSCALSGMSSSEMVDENARVASIDEPLNDNDHARISEVLKQTKRLADLYCTGCDYCMPCPKGIKISEVFQLMNYHRVYGLTDFARKQFNNLGKDAENGQSPSVCSECGACETKCPQYIKVRQRLKECIRELSQV